MIEGEKLHFADMRRLDRSDVKAVVDPEPPVDLPVHFRHEVAVWAASIEIILTGAQVIEARRYATHRRRLAFRYGVPDQGLIDPDMHVSIDAAGKSEKIFGVEYFLGLICLDIGGDTVDLPVRDPDVAAVHRRLVRAHNAGVFD
jgi:hypothetical protein